MSQIVNAHVISELRSLPVCLHVYVTVIHLRIYTARNKQMIDIRKQYLNIWQFF